MGSRILLADDSITIQKVVNLTFADEGIEVIAVSNGDMAERRLSEVKPDLVLADIFMPGKNGYELCELIKQNPQFRNVPVVLLVGAFEPFDQNEARRVQADAHLTKPFESRTLVETVQRLIGARARTNTGPITSASTNEPAVVMDAEMQPPPMTASQPARLDLSAMMVDRKVSTVAATIRNTGELASPSPVTETKEMFELHGADTRSSEEVNALATAAGETETPFEMPLIDEFQGDEEMILDFEKSETFESAVALNTGSFETESNAVLDIDPGSAAGQSDWFGQDSFDTRALEAPSPATGSQTDISAPAVTYQSSDFGIQTNETSSPASGFSESVRATLLVDDPLGDVLLDNPVSPSMLKSSNGSLDIELTEPVVHGNVLSTQFDLVETVENPSQQVLVGLEEDMPEQGALESHAEVVGSNNDSHFSSDAIADSLDWTSPQAGVYSTAQLDSVMMPVDTAEYLRAHSAKIDARLGASNEEPAFESAALWPEEEARFSAIDIEAFAVDEPAAEETIAAPDQLEAAETGFSLSSIVADQPSASSSRPAESMSDGSGVSRHNLAELSSAAIDEIVRRVVAEMSSSVVREVAWEVVPDCVERVIDQLTRESLSRRL